MISRRSLLGSTALILSPLSTGIIAGCSNFLSPAATSDSADFSGSSLIPEIGPLTSADENGVMLPDGFTSRIVARSGVAATGKSPYLWHGAPDGGAVFNTVTNGWIYVSNCELGFDRGGAGALEFDASGEVINSYSILENTNVNCAGGATPWGTWLSCEEVDNGMVWECDPHGVKSPVARPALGTFMHEAVAVDTQHHILYLTEDRPDGCFYRYLPDSIDDQGIPDLVKGQLQVAVVDGINATVDWKTLPYPVDSPWPTRYQLSSSTRFNGGEGIVYFQGIISFTTKGDNRVWSYDTNSSQISIKYDAARDSNPILTGVDNIALSSDGELLVAEDGGDLQIVAIGNKGELKPLIQLVGHDRSEITGPAFSPDGKRLYFSSQRGAGGRSKEGITFEVRGPFHA